MRWWLTPGRSVYCVLPVAAVHRYQQSWIECPEVGREYRLRDVLTDRSGLVGVHLAEIVNPRRFFVAEGRVVEPRFAWNLFSPVQSPEVMAIVRMATDRTVEANACV